MSKILLTFTKIYVIAILCEKQSDSFHSVWSFLTERLKYVLSVLNISRAYEAQKLYT